jgi:ABC-type antimicrobial peptide transport system permease subunit
MNLPLSYSLRNLAVRRTSSFMTALGIALSVAVLVSLLALVEGLRSSFASSAHPLHVIVMRKGSQAELLSAIPRSAAQEIRVHPGIAAGADGEPLASFEMVTVLVLKNAEHPRGINVTVRGLTPTGFAMREHLRLAAGRMFQPGRREVVVGESIARRYPEARLGGRLRFGRGEWDVVGVFAAGPTAFGSEIFADLNQVASGYNRSHLVSSVLVRATDASAARALINAFEGNRNLNVMAQLEQDYFDAQTVSALPVKFAGFIIAVIMAIGSGLAAMNTMYAAVARRSAEIATLRVLGFPRSGILAAFLLESLLLALAGGALGCLLALPIAHLRTGIGNMVTFSEVVFQFRITPPIAAAGLLFGLLMGAAGGLRPALTAARQPILTALRRA